MTASRQTFFLGLAGESWAGPAALPVWECRRGVVLWVCENGGPSNGGTLCPHAAACSHAPLSPAVRAMQGGRAFPPTDRTTVFS